MKRKPHVTGNKIPWIKSLCTVALQADGSDSDNYLRLFLKVIILKNWLSEEETVKTSTAIDDLYDES